jgi:hypothetical protein
MRKVIVGTAADYRCRGARAAYRSSSTSLPGVRIALL